MFDLAIRIYNKAALPSSHSYMERPPTHSAALGEDQPEHGSIASQTLCTPLCLDPAADGHYNPQLHRPDSRE